MNTPQKLGLIINPNSGTIRQKQFVEAEVMAFFAGHDLVVFKTQKQGDAERKAREWAEAGLDCVAVAGGDGTLNEVANGLYGFTTGLFMLPMGSGNGYARHFGLASWEDSFRSQPQDLKKVEVAVGSFNGKYFLNVAGIGLDAFLAKTFQESEKRGLGSYVKKTVGALFSANTYQKFGFTVDQRAQQGWWLVAALGSQYGNDYFISEAADPAKGQFITLDIPCPNGISIMGWVAKGPAKCLEVLPDVKMEKRNELQITFDRPVPCHVDGEPVGDLLEVDIQIASKKLTLWLP